jgi:hypothetical protein
MGGIEIICKIGWIVKMGDNSVKKQTKEMIKSGKSIIKNGSYVNL